MTALDQFADERQDLVSDRAQEMRTRRGRDSPVRAKGHLGSFHGV